MIMRKNLPAFMALLGLFAAGALGPAAVGAQNYLDDFMFHPPRATVTLALGYGVPNVGSDLFDEVTSTFTLDKGDFRAPVVGGGISFFLSERTDLAFEIFYSKASSWAEYVDYVGGDDLPIEHETSFTQVPLTGSVRYYLKDRGRQVGSLSWIPTTWTPYIGAGGGLMYYEFQQAGEFINFEIEDWPIYRDTISSSGWAWVGHAFGGVQWSLSPQVVISAEGRYSLAEKDLDRGAFGSFDPIDLSGLRGSVGFGIRF